MAQETKIPIWLDCDPGHDDAFAILLAAHHPNLLPLGISTVHGNSSLAHTTRNALSVLTAISSTQIPVYAGASQGLTRPAVHASAIHGTSGLDGTSLLPVPALAAQDYPAVEAMAKALLSFPSGTAWVVATGALTNIALAFEKYPSLASNIKGISIMGGAIGNGFTNATLGSVDGVPRVGNWSAHAEFNVLVDPEAAAYIFSHPILKTKAILIPLDVTHLVLATKEVQQLLLKGKEGGSGETKLRRMLVELVNFFAVTYAEVFGIIEGPPLHDPLAVAAILDGIEGVEIPFWDFDGDGGKRERFEVKIITEGSHDDAAGGAETGKTVVRLLDEGEEGVKIPRDLDIKRFWGILEDALERADEANRVNGVV